MKNIPKIELHCHLDGSLRPGTVLELAKTEGIEIDTNDFEVLKKQLVASDSCKNHGNASH